jgi:hypothetical protein
MPKLKLNHSLKTLKTEQQVVTLIIAEIHEQFNGINLETLKNNTQLLKDVMNAVENIITNKKISKKNIVLNSQSGLGLRIKTVFWDRPNFDHSFFLIFYMRD